MEEEVKRCTKCRKWKPMSEFAKLSRNKEGVRSICYECFRAYRRDKYHNTYVKKNGIFYGIVGSYEGPLLYKDGRPTIYWSDSMLAQMRKLYPCTKTEELAEIMGIAVSTIRIKARQLGIKKDPEYLLQQRRKQIRIASASISNETKQRTGAILAERGKATRFKKGESYLMTLTKEERDDICRRAGLSHRRSNLRKRREQEV